MCGQTPLDSSSQTNKNSSNGGGSGGNGTIKVPVPTGISANAISASEIVVEWINPNLDDNFTIQLEYKKSVETEFKEIPSLDVASYHISGLSENTSYDIRLKTVVESGDSSNYSSTITAKTKINAVSTPLSKPTDVKMKSLNQLPVTWTYALNANVDKFVLEYNVWSEFSMVPVETSSVDIAYLTSDSTYEGTINITSTKCRTDETTTEITYRVQALPKDLARNTASEWVDVPGATACIHPK